MRRQRILLPILIFACLVALFLLLRQWPSLPKNAVLILEYHSINTSFDEDSKPYTLDPADFDAQLTYLQNEGYHAITMLDFEKAMKSKETLPDKPLIITFDDGYEDNYTIALPILEKHKMRAELYVITNAIDTEGYLNWQELGDMQNRGIEIGCHSADHLPLPTLSKAEQIEQIQTAKIYLERYGIRNVFSFSYPNGLYDAETGELLRACNYLTAVTGDSGYNTFATDPYYLQRVQIPRPKLGLWEFRLRLLRARMKTAFGIGQHLR